VSKRSIYRWLKAYLDKGLVGLMTKRRIKQRTSAVLDEALLDYLARQKREDPAASIPELIKRAVQEGLIPHRKAVNRGTVWQALRRMGVKTGRGHPSKKRQCQRFAYAHRLEMVLCDGKHFRAGVSRA
jgi:transposase